MGEKTGPSARVSAKGLTTPPGSTIKYPIELTPRMPYLTGVAALVFASADVFSPADNLAEFGVEGQPKPDSLYPIPSFVQAPHEGARVIAWVRPPEVDRKYNIDFNCQAFPWLPYEVGSVPNIDHAASFTLETSDGGKETVQGTRCRIGRLN